LSYLFFQIFQFLLQKHRPKNPQTPNHLSPQFSYHIHLMSIGNSPAIVDSRYHFPWYYGISSKGYSKTFFNFSHSVFVHRLKMKVLIIFAIIAIVCGLGESRGARTVPRLGGRTPQYLRNRVRDGRIIGGEDADIAHVGFERT
jgi:hypothetical protein